MATTKIMVVSWNANSVALCESLVPEVVRQNRSGISGITRASCQVADFFSSLAAKITRDLPDIVVFGFLESPKPGDYFFSEFLRDEMPRIGYNFVTRTRLGGIGKADFTTLKSKNLRIGVYARREYSGAKVDDKGGIAFELQESTCSGPSFLESLSRGSGGKAVYLRLNGALVALVCEHLPFSTGGLVDAAAVGDPLIRQNELNYANICFNSLYRRMVLDRGVLDSKAPVDFAIVFGDFNYRIVLPGSNRQVTEQMMVNADNRQYWNGIYTKNDELYLQGQKQNIYSLKEGVNGSGPTFLPNCNLLLNRPANCDPGVAKAAGYPLAKAGECFDLDVLGVKDPSWCTRILYNKVSNRVGNIECADYERFDIGTAMKKSDQAGVLAVIVVNS